MMSDHNHYTYRVTWSVEDGEYIALCAEFPSLSFLADSQSDALAGMVNLVEDVIQDMRSNSETIPQPFADRQYSGKLMLRIPPETHRNLMIQAAEQGISLNRYISSKLT